MTNLGWLIRKSLMNTFRSRKSWFVYVGLPLLGVLVSFLMYGHGQDSVLRVGLVQGDGQQAISQDVTAYISGLTSFRVTELAEDDMKRQLADGKLDVGIVLDPGFGDSVRDGHPQGVRVVSVKGAQVTGYLTSLLNGYIANVAAIGRAAGDDDHAFEHMMDAYHHGKLQVDVQHQPDSSGDEMASYQSIGFLIAFMLFSALFLTDILQKEKENRTYFRLMASPVTGRVYVLSNVLVSLMVVLVQIIVTLFVMRVILHLSLGMPVLVTGGILLLFGLTAIGLALMVVALTNSSSSANALGNLIVTPTCLLSGCYFPMSIMPDAVQKISRFMPQHWLLDAFTKLQDGGGVDSYGLDLLILIGYAAAFSLIAIYKFNRNNDTRMFI